MKEPMFLVIDLFCGCGGTTQGFEMTGGIAEVIACVNHDPKAIRSHWRNHPHVKHFEEDIRTLELTELIELVNYYRAKYPGALVILWASLECTNFSKAKGGQPRDADSRTLADHLNRYVIALDPDYIQIENVVEFMAWGPLDENGKPVSRKNGQDWLRWRKLICSHGYQDEWRELNSANYGAYTSRNRLFGIFAKDGLPIAWPTPTHAKNPTKAGMHGDLQKWKAVKEVLNFEDEGESIFNRKVPLVDKTLQRILAGLEKYVAKGDNAFISKYYSGKPAGKNIPVDGPAGTVTCIDGQALVQSQFLLNHCQTGYTRGVDVPAPTLLASGSKSPVHLIQPRFLLKYNSTDKKGKHYPPSVDEPCPVIVTQNRLGLVQPQFLVHYYGQGGQLSSIENPAPTVTTKDRAALVQPEYLVNYNHSSLVNDVNDPAPTLVTKDRLSLIQPEYFIDKHYGNCSQNQSIEQPAGTIMPQDKHRLVEVSPFIMPTNYNNGPRSINEPSPVITANRKHHYLVNPSWQGCTGSVDEPCPVVIARQDKVPLSLLQVEAGRVAIAVYPEDSEVMVKVKQFMVLYELVDIKMRMLRVGELLKIQGFPDGYRLEGNQSDMKKFIGNSVVPHVVKAWTLALAGRINEKRREVA